MNMVKIRSNWYLLRNVDGFMEALADYWHRPLTDEEHRDLIRPLPHSFPMMLYMSRGGDYPAYPLLQGVSLHQLNSALDIFNETK